MTRVEDLKQHLERLERLRDQYEDCGAPTDMLDAEIEHVVGAIHDAELELVHAHT